MLRLDTDVKELDRIWAQWHSCDLEDLLQHIARNQGFSVETFGTGEREEEKGALLQQMVTELMGPVGNTGHHVSFQDLANELKLDLGNEKEIQLYDVVLNLSNRKISLPVCNSLLEKSV